MQVSELKKEVVGGKEAEDEEVQVLNFICLILDPDFKMRDAEDVRSSPT